MDRPHANYFSSVVEPHNHRNPPRAFKRDAFFGELVDIAIGLEHIMQPPVSTPQAWADLAKAHKVTRCDLLKFQIFLYQFRNLISVVDFVPDSQIDDRLMADVAIEMNTLYGPVRNSLDFEMEFLRVLENVATSLCIEI